MKKIKNICREYNALFQEKTKQESPPASYPGRVPPPVLTWQGTPLGVCPMEFWVMLQSIMGHGYPPPPVSAHGILGNVAKHYGIWVPPPPSVCPMAFWEMLQSIMGYGYHTPPPQWTDRLMDGRTDACQNITFPSYYVRGR